MNIVNIVNIVFNCVQRGSTVYERTKQVKFLNDASLPHFYMFLHEKD